MGVQELRAAAEDVAGRFDAIGPLKGHFHHAQKKGYAGVGLYTPHAPSRAPLSKNRRSQIELALRCGFQLIDGLAPQLGAPQMRRGK